jgi:hypothetical protein
VASWSLSSGLFHAEEGIRHSHVLPLIFTSSSPATQYVVALVLPAVTFWACGWGSTGHAEQSLRVEDNELAVRVGYTTSPFRRKLDDTTTILALPAAYRKRLSTTNGIEWLNEEIHRERVMARELH